MSNMRKLLSIAALALTIVVAGCTSPSNPPTADAAGTPLAEALEAVPMVSHIQFGVFEQDVFIAQPGGVGQVVRPTPADAASSLTKEADLWTTAQPQDHDPTFQHAGPFAAGQRLGVTLSSWLDARGSAAYLCTGGTTGRIDARFEKLVPNGVYTFWNSRLDFRDGAIVGAEDFPAGRADGSQNRFTADQDGHARFSVAWAGCTDPATGGPLVGPTGSGHVFAIAYHSDGKTYGAGPGPFGQHAHVQLFGFVRAVRA